MTKRTRMTVSLSPAEYARLHEPRSVRIRKAMLRALGYITAATMMWAVICFLAINILTSCGQAIYNADGTYETGTCHPAWLYPASKQRVKGRWQ